MSTWTDELKAKAIEMYKEREPTADNSTEIVKDIAEELGQSPNGVRMILIKAEAYIKKTPSPAKSSTAASGDKAPRVSKEAAHARLTAAIEGAGQTADSEIVSKLTGKAAQHFAEIIEAITSND